MKKIPVSWPYLDFKEALAAKKVLNLALDQTYGNKEQQILDNTRKYINDRLGY